MTASHANHDMEPSRERRQGGGNYSEDDITPEELALVRSAARKILQSFQASLSEALESRDRLKEGLVSREDVQKIIEEQKVPELQMVELSLLMKSADRGNKGYIVIDKFIEKLQELATETKQETVLKNFALACKRQALTLKKELMQYDTKRENRLDKRTFLKALSQLSITLNDEQVE
jgi:hypothetical protein